jgi:hypothetical protein
MTTRSVPLLLLLVTLFIAGCADEAFLPPPENLPYTQEHEKDSEAPSGTPGLQTF